jgi:hypothetical protein
MQGSDQPIYASIKLKEAFFFNHYYYFFKTNVTQYIRQGSIGLKIISNFSYLVNEGHWQQWQGMYDIAI